MKWLGLDPSIAGYGWASFAGGTLQDCGTWHTKQDKKAKRKGDDRARRLDEIGRQLLQLVDAFRPDGAVIESITIGPQQTRMTASVLGRVRGLTEGICLARRLVLVEVTPQSVKRKFCGSHDAPKDQVARAARMMFPNCAGAGFDATDAVAVGWTGQAELATLLQITNLKPNYSPPAAAPAGDELGF